MSPQSEARKVKAFIRANLGKKLFSTGARIVHVKDVLYNITGSTDDPKEVRDYEGQNWKSLLILKADLGDARCYVTNVPAPPVSDHDNFSVGGHMTTNPDGEVAVGGVSYLMPLCKWHNSTARNGDAYTHDESKMLRLTGFMEGETPATFMMRMPSDKSHVLLYFDQLSDSWKYNHVDSEQALAPKARLFSSMGGLATPKEFALFEKRGDGFFIADSNLTQDDEVGEPIDPRA